MSSQERSLAPQISDTRFEYLRPLGQGGAGVVYLVRDRETGEQLALKRLLRADTQSVLRLKREFRSLAGIHHPNLIKLFDLGHDGSAAFFTMEYVAGSELFRHLGTVGTHDATGTRALGDASAHNHRVLSAFHQLASGVRALHRAGVLHRDLKPSNVMVAGERVVVLDFGIALDLGESAATITHSDAISGTPAYMAPEQVQGEHVGEPNDWYAFGAILYEALSGCLPIEGRNAMELMRRKLRDDPEPIALHAPDLPREISELCMAMLQRAPEQRPSGEDILSALRPYASPVTGGSSTSASITAQASLLDGPVAIVGRERELSALREAFAAAQSGRFVVAHVAGESGAGKSALVQHFLDDVERVNFRGASAAPLLLRSRCYERETMPFKALDGVMDALVNHLLRESDFVVGHALPSDLRGLTQLFPTLQRLPAVMHLLAQAKPLGAARHAREQAQSALRELLVRLASLSPMVIWIDDLQWGDLDSAGILADWFTSSGLEQILLVLSYRSEELTTSPCLATLRQTRLGEHGDEVSVNVSALGDDDIRALCQQNQLLANSARSQTDVIARIVHEAQGSPFLASQLAALAASQPRWSKIELGHLTVQQLVLERSGSLSDAARRLLRVLSVAARPISWLLAARTVGLDRDVRAVIHELQGLSLIRTRNVGAERLLEVYHDRLREAVSASLSVSERSELDRNLMRELLAAGCADADWLHSLALATDDRDAALRYGLVAAERAEVALAFERAVELYQRCIALSEDSPAGLWQKLAVALAHTGRGAPAAEAYLQAAQRSDAEQALQLERFAASHLLRIGHFEEGEKLLARVLDKLKLSAPRSETGLLAAIAWERSRLALRGLSFTPRELSDVPADLKPAAELCNMLAVETAGYDPLRAALFQVRGLRLALDAGWPEGVARALCVAATMASISGTADGGRKANELLDRAESLGRDLDSALVISNVCSARTICAWMQLKSAETVELSYEADRLYRTLTSEGEYHHRFSVIAARVGALLQLCDFPRAAIEIQSMLKEADATGNVSAQLQITLGQTRIDLLADRPQLAAARLERQLAQLPQHGFGLLHIFHLVAVHRVACATDDYAWAERCGRDNLLKLRNSVVRHSIGIGLIVHATHARLLVNQCVSERRPEAAAKAVANALQTMAKMKKNPLASAVVARTRARLAFLSGQREAAIAQLRTSIAGFIQYRMLEEVPRDNYALGAWLGGDEGAALQTTAIAQLRELGFANPLADIFSYFPELRPESRP